MQLHFELGWHKNTPFLWLEAIIPSDALPAIAADSTGSCRFLLYNPQREASIYIYSFPVDFPTFFITDKLYNPDNSANGFGGWIMSGKSAGIVMKAGEAALKWTESFVAQPKVRRAGEYLLKAVLGFIISQAVIFGEYSPFGIGYVAALGGSVSGLIGTLGVILGYSSLWRMADSLKYAAGTVLTFAAMYIFRNLPFASGKFFAPFAAAASAFFVGFVFVAERGFAAADVILFGTEIILVFASAYFYREALGADKEEKAKSRDALSVKAISVFALTATILIALSDVRLIAGISAGKLVAVLFVMLAAQRGGFGIGCAAGVSMGMAFDIAGGGGFYSMAYGFSGLIAGITGKMRRLPTAIAFVMTNAVVALVNSRTGINTSALYEAFAGSVLFLLIPEKVFPDLRYLGEPRSRNPMHADKMSAMLKRRISGASKAFMELYEAVKGTIEQSAVKNTQDISRVFDRAAEKVCRGCALKGVCWERDCMNTYNVMNDLTQNLSRKGQIATEDFAQYFIARCLKPDSFITAINGEMKSFLNMKRYRSRLNFNRGIVCGQFSEVSSILKEIAEEVTSGIEEDIDAGAYIEHLLSDVRDASVLVWRNSHGRISVDIEARNLSPLRARLDGFTAELEKLFHKSMGAPEYTSDITNDRIRIRECEPFSVRIGVAARKRKNSAMSGDCGTYFKTEEGKIYIILSDGMGSGREAAVESGSVVRLLEKFIRAGVDAGSALRTVNLALMLRNMEETGFATLDLLEIDLFTGDGRFYKCGAAPSFIRAGKKLRRVSGKVFPPGTGILPSTCEASTLVFEGNEVLVMLSDGAYISEEEDGLQQELLKYQAGTPKQLALQLAGDASAKNLESDDATAVVIEIVRNER